MVKRHSPEPGPSRGIRPGSILGVWVLCFLLLPAAATAAPAEDPPGSDPGTPEATVRTVDPGAPGRLSPPVRATPPRAGALGEGRSKGPRTLDEINIEGEIAVPQVLFITARDRKRYRDLLHRRYLDGSTEIGRELALPARLGSMLGSAAGPSARPMPTGSPTSTSARCSTSMLRTEGWRR